MKKILPAIIFLCLGVSLMAQSIQNKVELKKIISENSIFTLYAKRTMAFQSQKANTLSTMLLDSIVTKNAAGTYTSKESHFRDNNERDTLIVDYAWNSTTSKWEMNQKNQLINDLTGNITSSTTYSILGGYVLGTSRYTASYDINNHQTVYTTYTWDMITSAWVADTKKETSYNANGKETVSMDYTWQSGINSWQLTDKEEYSYNGNGFLIQEIDSKLNTNTSLLENNLKYTFSNDATGRDTLATNYSWNSNTTAWDLSGKIVTAFNTNGEPSLIATYQWESNTSTWQGLFKAVYTFDGTNLSTLILYTWDIPSSSWVAFTKTEDSFNSNGNITVETTYVWNVNAWVKQSVANYYYSPAKNTAVNDIANGHFKVYPNPVIDLLHIDFITKSAAVSIVDIVGKIVYSEQQFVGDKIEVSSLRSGIYFLTINTGTEKYTFKFVKD